MATATSPPVVIARTGSISSGPRPDGPLGGSAACLGPPDSSSTVWKNRRLNSAPNGASTISNAVSASSNAALARHHRPAVVPDHRSRAPAARARRTAPPRARPRHRAPVRRTEQQAEEDPHTADQATPRPASTAPTFRPATPARRESPARSARPAGTAAPCFPALGPTDGAAKNHNPNSATQLANVSQSSGPAEPRAIATNGTREADACSAMTGMQDERYQERHLPIGSRTRPVHGDSEPDTDHQRQDDETNAHWSRACRQPKRVQRAGEREDRRQKQRGGAARRLIDG